MITNLTVGNWPCQKRMLSGCDIPFVILNGDDTANLDQAFFCRIAIRKYLVRMPGSPQFNEDAFRR